MAPGETKSSSLDSTKGLDCFGLLWLLDDGLEPAERLRPPDKDLDLQEASEISPSPLDGGFDPVLEGFFDVVDLSIFRLLIVVDRMEGLRWH